MKAVQPDAGLPEWVADRCYWVMLKHFLWTLPTTRSVTTSKFYAILAMVVELFDPQGEAQIRRQGGCVAMKVVMHRPTILANAQAAGELLPAVALFRMLERIPEAAGLVHVVAGEGDRWISHKEAP